MPPLGSGRIGYIPTEEEADAVRRFQRLLGELVGVQAVHNFTTGRIREAGVTCEDEHEWRGAAGGVASGSDAGSMSQPAPAARDVDVDQPEYPVVRDKGHPPIAALADRGDGALAMPLDGFRKGRRAWKVAAAVQRRIVEAAVSDPFLFKVGGDRGGDGGAGDGYEAAAPQAPVWRNEEDSQGAGGGDGSD